MKIKYTQTKKGFTLVELLVVMSIIAVLASIATPLVMNKRREADKTKAISNAKQIYMGMLEFENEYGIRPGAQITTEGNVDGAATATSNDCFRQLLQGLATVRTEAIFFAPSKAAREPDNDIGDATDDFANAIAKGECGFRYVDAVDANDGAAIAAAPMTLANDKFDFQAYNGKAVILKTDGSVSSLNIKETDDKVYTKVGGSDVEVLSTSNPAYNDEFTIIELDPR